MGSRYYALSYIPPTGKEPPKVVFTIAKHLQDKLEDALRTLHRRCELNGEAKARLAGFGEFSLFEDFFEPGRFGYGGCGMRTEREDEVRYAVSLRGPAEAFSVAITIEYLLTALRYAGVEQRKRPSNHKQIFDVEFGCSPTGRQALGGSFDASAGEWFYRRGQEGPSEAADLYSPEAFVGYPLKDDGPRKAMEEAWKAVVPADLKPFADHCKVSVKPAGNFALICLGCNVAAFHDIAPEMNTGHPGRFTCWNLDNVYQLLTCFAGLAALYEVLAKDLG